MIQEPIQVLEKFPVRKSKEQKAAFTQAIMEYAQKQGYAVKVEEEKRSVHNIVIGQPDSAQYLITAHYDTPASIGLPNLIAPNNPVAFFGIQFALVGIMLLAAVVVGFCVYWISGYERAAYLVGYFFYLAILLLMLKGPANRSNANDNTSGVVTVLQILTKLPENLRDRVCFVLFDMEEAGLVGSAAYRKRHKDATENQWVLNLDCVGDGDIIQLTPVKKAREDSVLLNRLSRICGKAGEKELRLRSKGFYKGSSDHKNFPKGVAIMAFQCSKLIGLYCGRIHTWRDTILEETNVCLLRDRLIALVADDQE